MRAERFMKASAAAIVAASMMAGCASGPPRFPDPRDAVVRVVSGAAPDGGEYAIPNSQVYVSGTHWGSGVAASVGVVALGVAGGLAAGAAADQIRNRAAISDHESTVALRYDQIVAQRLREAGLAGGVSSDSPARVVLIPKARLVRFGDSLASVMCTLEAKYSVGGMAESYVHRTYSYTAPASRPLSGKGEGWTDNNGAAFRAASEPPFKALADAFAADWNGHLSVANARTVQVRRGDQDRPALLLREIGDYVVLAGGHPGAPKLDATVVVERSAIVQ